VLHDTHKIVRLMGQGGMGAVYEAVHSRLRNRRFAIKVLHAKMASKDVILARFKREAEIATSLGHPHIIDVMDFYETDGGRPCMVMEYLEGEDLDAILEEHKTLDREVAVKLVTQVGSALQAVHEKGIVHRDLKPANIFLVCSGTEDALAGNFEVKVLDFGISKMLDPDSVYTNLTAEKAVMGTPHYMSPEQGEGLIKEVDHRTDIFALGTICYQLLSGAKPFNAPSLPSVIYKICHADPVPVTGHAPDVPEAVNRVLLKAMAKKREDRYQQVEDFVQELEEALLASPGASDTEPAPDPNQTNVMGLDELLSDASIKHETAVLDAPVATADEGQEEPAERGRETRGASGSKDVPAEQAADPNSTNVMGIDELVSEQEVIAEPGPTTLSGAAAESQVPVSSGEPGKRRWPLAAGLGVLVVVLVLVGFVISGKNPREPAAVAKAAAHVPESRTTPPIEAPAPVSKKAPDPPPVERKVASPPSAGAPPTKQHAPEPAPAAPKPSTTVAEPEPEPAPSKPSRKDRRVRILFKLKPADAVAYINGTLHGRRPLSLPRSKKSYQVTISAKGFVSRTVTVTARRSRSVRIVLEKKAAPKPNPKPKPKNKPAADPLITDL